MAERDTLQTRTPQGAAFQSQMHPAGGIPQPRIPRTITGVRTTHGHARSCNDLDTFQTRGEGPTQTLGEQLAGRVA